MVALLPSALLALAGPAAVGYKWGETGGELELRRHLCGSLTCREAPEGARLGTGAPTPPVLSVLLDGVLTSNLS